MNLFDTSIIFSTDEEFYKEGDTMDISIDGRKFVGTVHDVRVIKLVDEPLEWMVSVAQEPKRRQFR